jgi:tRNA A-37 threonylcarbamoyl transferase component Bud32
MKIRYVHRDWEPAVRDWAIRPGETALVSQGRGRSLSIARFPRGRVYIKTFSNDRGLIGSVVGRGRYRARREFRNLVKARNLGVCVPEPVAILDRPGGAELWTRELEGFGPLRSYLLSDPPPFAARSEVLKALGRFLRDLFVAGMDHRDLHGGNLLVQPSDRRFAVVDLSSVRFGRVSRRRRIEIVADVLSSLQIGLNLTDYARVLLAFGESSHRVWRRIQERMVELRAKFVENRAEKAMGWGSGFVRRRIGSRLVVYPQDVDPEWPERVLARLNKSKERDQWLPLEEGLFYRHWRKGERWWKRSWKLRYNLVDAPLGRLWARNDKDLIVAEWPEGMSSIEAAPKDDPFMSDLGRFVRRLHELGVSIPKFCWKDLLCRHGEGGYRFGLADPSRADCVVEMPPARRTLQVHSLFAPLAPPVPFLRAYAGWSRP